jgi:hypothetical protein
MATGASLITLAAAGLVLGACATQTHRTARLDEAHTLASAPAEQPMAIAESGTFAAAWGDKWTAANLFERSADKDNSVVARFDLASAYERTGRLSEAAALYRGLVRDGQFMWGVTNVDYRNRGARLTRFNIADESARRLAILERRLEFATGPTAGALAASELGTPTAARVGGPAPVLEHRISNAEAMRLDAQGAP